MQNQNTDMTILIRYFYLIILVGLTSCSIDRKVNSKMDLIKEVGDTNPAYARTMLDSLEVKVRSMSKHTQMRYDLLSIRLDDKADKIPTSDFMAKEILDFYIHNGNEREKQEAYYYAGSVYRDLNDTPRAMEFFLESCKIAETNSGMDSIMLRNAYSQLVHLYSNTQDYINELEMAKKEYGIAKQLNAVTLNATLHVAGAYVQLDSTELAEQKLKETLRIIKQSKAIENERNFLYYTMMNMADLNILLSAKTFLLKKIRKG